MYYFNIDLILVQYKLMLELQLILVRFKPSVGHVIAFDGWIFGEEQAMLTLQVH